MAPLEQLQRGEDGDELALGGHELALREADAAEQVGKEEVGAYGVESLVRGPGGPMRGSPYSPPR